MTHPTAAHPAVAPVGFWDRLAIVVLGLAGCALSYDALQQMAVAIHVRGLLTYLFPLVVDGFIAYGVRALLVLSEAPLRARLYVWVLFGTATAASIWANALHAVRLNQQTTHSGLRLSDTVVAILSTLAPLALAGAVHLYILITRYHPADPMAVRLEEKRPADHEHGPAEGASPASADQGAPADQMPDREHPQTTNDAARTTDQPADSTPADHDTTAPDQQTNPAPDHDTDHDAPAADHPADQQISAGPQADSEGRTSNGAGQAAPSAHRPADHVWVDHEHGPAEAAGPASADQGAPADQMPDREHPQTTNDAARTTDQPADSTPADHDTTAPDQQTNPAPDHDTDHDAAAADHPADQPADPGEGGSSGGPQGARTTNHDALAPGPRTKPADQDEVPWEAKVAVARKAALAEGRMTRRAIRPHLRNANITVSNELFSDLQAALYADPALAHLPRDTRRAR
ncbi:DUF2637 domain-containing protein [Streptomyces huasconensis]|uniref:DUF2637 domain-containing protein n=1 Tax=Streptomyces huasconensis TaxID=1854574 RepID=UPI003F4CB033